jgi:elongation factor Ts
MANISTSLIKQLRDKTQVGMMDCKKALIEASGNIEKAVELLRKKGAAIAAKRAGHVVENGRIEGYISDNFKQGALIEVACETDFSANTDDMKQFTIQTAQLVVATGKTSVDELLGSQKELKNQYDELLAKISENIKINKIMLFSVEEYGIVNIYIHPGSTVGVLVELKTDLDKSQYLDELRTVARDICMHVAVTNPLCVGPNSLDPDVLKKEQEIMKEQLKNSGKPDNIIEKIMVGKTDKYYKEVCLTKQQFIKNDKLSVEEHLNQVGDKIENTITIKQFIRFGIGGK